WFRAALKKRGVRAFIADHDGAVAGYALSVIHDRPESVFCHATQSCEIDQIAVLPSHRRQGIARALVSCALEDARSRGIRELELNSWSFNTEAHAAFQALGLTPKTM